MSYRDKRLPLYAIGRAPVEDTTAVTLVAAYNDAVQVVRYFGAFIPEWADFSKPWKIRCLHYGDADISTKVLRVTYAVTRTRADQAITASGIVSSASEDYTIAGSTPARTARRLELARWIPTHSFRPGDHLTLNLTREGAHANDTLTTVWRVLYPPWITWGD